MLPCGSVMKKVVMKWEAAGSKETLFSVLLENGSMRGVSTSK